MAQYKLFLINFNCNFNCKMSRFNVMKNLLAGNKTFCSSVDISVGLVSLLAVSYAVQPTASSSWSLGLDEDSVYDVQTSSLTMHGHSLSDTDDLISTLYARMLIGETGRTQQPPGDDYWSADSVGPSTGCSGTMAADAESAPFLGTSGALADLCDDDNCWSGYSAFFGADFSARHLRRGLGADDAGTLGGAWRLNAEGVAAAIDGSCGSDGATSSSSRSPAESSTGSAA